MEMCQDCKTKGDYDTCIVCLQREIFKDKHKQRGGS